MENISVSAEVYGKNGYGNYFSQDYDFNIEYTSKADYVHDCLKYSEGGFICIIKPTGIDIYPGRLLQCLKVN